MELWQIKAILNDLGVEPDLASQITWHLHGVNLRP